MNWALERHPAFKGVDGPVVVCVMDGVGIGRQDASDAVWLARTPTLDALAAQPGAAPDVEHAARAAGRQVQQLDAAVRELGLDLHDAAR